MEVQDGGRKLNAVIIGSPNVNPGYILVSNKDIPRIADDYEKSFNVLLNFQSTSSSARTDPISTCKRNTRV